MDFFIGDRVRVRTSEGGLRVGEVMVKIKNPIWLYPYFECEYGIKYEGDTKVHYHPAHDLSIFQHMLYRCTCGSNKLGHPGHSLWCDENRYYNGRF